MKGTMESGFTSFLFFEQIIDELSDFIMYDLWKNLKISKDEKNDYLNSPLYNLQYTLIEKKRVKTKE